MIDAFEEEKKTWCLQVPETLYDNTRLLSRVKALLHWTQAQVTECKSERRPIVATGARTRLEALRQAFRELPVEAIVVECRNERAEGC